jgi:hypothetical protein
MPDTTITAQPQSATTHTGRNVTIIGLLIGVVGAAAPVVGSMDLSSSAGIIAAIVAMSAVIVKYLDGWQKYEARLDGQPAADPATPAEEPAAPAQEPVPPAEEAVATDPDEGATVITIAPPAPNGGSANADVVGDPDEPPAPVPGEDTGLELVAGDELGDIPEPPTDEEIAAVHDELTGGMAPARAA